MATQGSHIFNGYVKNIGMVRVYQDLDNPNFVFSTSIKTGEEYYMIRTRVQPRKTKRPPFLLEAPLSVLPEAPVQDFLF